MKKKRTTGTRGGIALKRAVDFGCTTCGRVLSEGEQMFTNNGGCCSLCLKMYRDQKKEFTVCK